eukprot:scaffold5511_cov19-Tisochrysis_lutea.AAC.2
MFCTEGHKVLLHKMCCSKPKSAEPSKLLATIRLKDGAVMSTSSSCPSQHALPLRMTPLLAVCLTKGCSAP